MKVYDIIDRRETPAKKITIAHEGDACDVAREYCGKSLLLHFPETEGKAAVVKWYGTDEAAVIVKPARVVDDERPHEEEARRLCDAIKALADDFDALLSFENYLSRHLRVWFDRWVTSPEGLIDELERFSR